MKKIVSLLLTLCLALGMVSMAVADEEGHRNDSPCYSQV